jgi:S1-C subfamily serine protease
VSTTHRHIQLRYSAGCRQQCSATSSAAIYSRTGGSLGIGFAIPISTAQSVIEQIVKTGTVVRGYIGVEPQDVTPELAEAFKLPRKDGVITVRKRPKPGAKS